MNNTFNVGDRSFQFALAEEPKTGIPMWATEMDELWLNIVGNDLYSFLNSNREKLATCQLDDRKDFAASTTVYVFKQQIFFGEAARFHDLVFMLRDVLAQSIGFPPMKMYVSIFSDSGDHYINVALDNEAILIGVRLGEMEENKIII